MTRNSSQPKLRADGVLTASGRPKEWLAPKWEKGQSGNPGGRPRGARSKLSELTLNKLLLDFEEHGTAAIQTVREKNPAAYLAAVVNLLPRQQEKVESPFADLSDEELQLLELFLRSTRAKQVTIDADATHLPDEQEQPT